VHGSDNKKEVALFVGMYSHKTYRCMCICTDDKYRERTKEKERRDIRRKKLSHSKGMNGLQRKREKNQMKKK